MNDASYHIDALTQVYIRISLVSIVVRICWVQRNPFWVVGLVMLCLEWFLVVLMTVLNGLDALVIVIAVGMSLPVLYGVLDKPTASVLERLPRKGSIKDTS